jgi:hypothetical protein
LLKDKSENKLVFPEISNDEMKILKEKIRKKYRVQKKKNILINILILSFILLLFYYLNLVKNNV